MRASRRILPGERWIFVWLHETRTSTTTKPFYKKVALDSKNN